MSGREGGGKQTASRSRSVSRSANRGATVHLFCDFLRFSTFNKKYFLIQLLKKWRIAGTCSVRDLGYLKLVLFFAFPELVRFLSQLSK